MGSTSLGREVGPEVEGRKPWIQTAETRGLEEVVRPRLGAVEEAETGLGGLTQMTPGHSCKDLSGFQ